ncbi:MAG TPA: helix-hairpin-helix domain-containing protein [Myxococcota bacterium]|nr:helix-hairpin-helix domain-containing protein [Myxococcota bacterium]
MTAIRNEDVAAIFDRVADLLQAQGASVWRVQAYRAGAETCRNAPRALAAISREGGMPALDALPGIGPTLAAHIREILATGRLGFLERLSGQVCPEDLFMTLPGVGERLAARIHAELGVETLEQLEEAAVDGRLAALRGVGPRRAQGFRDSLARVLGGAARLRALRARRDGEGQPSLATLLAVDRAYREGARTGGLPRITPRRLNPGRKAWLPVLHEERDGWSFTALFSNTARAHELGRTGDWVVLFAERDGLERRYTVVTETRGPLAGRRIVRGREAESAADHRAPSLAPAESGSAEPHPAPSGGVH